MSLEIKKKKIHHLNQIVFLGSSIGQAMSEHPDIRKLGFTGSTPIGKTIMERYYQSFVPLLFHINAIICILCFLQSVFIYSTAVPKLT